MKPGTRTIMDDRRHLTTEQRNPQSTNLDRLTTTEAFDLINREDASIAAAVAAAKKDICRAIDVVVDALRKGGRMFYVGAGTSGRLGVMDAAECPPTFLTDPQMLQGIIAGGDAALKQSVESAEDREEDGARAIDDCGVGPRDVVFGIATGGTTPFVHGAIREARHRSARTIFLACVPEEQVADDADVSIRVVTGPEVVTGSTRMKAGTATKIVLNMVSTIAMVGLGKVYGNLMVDVNAGVNGKLIDRALRMVETVTEVARPEAERLLRSAGWHVKTALVMHARQVTRESAEALLASEDGHLAPLLDEDEQNANNPTLSHHSNLH